MFNRLKNLKLRSCILIGIILGAVWFLGACSSDADIASENLSTAADNFEIERRIIFVNGITDEYLLEIEGRCSIVDEGGQLEVTCKVADDQFKKHFLGLSDNVTYVAEQIESADVSVYHYRVTFKPQSIVPDVDVRGEGGDELPQND